MNDMKIAVVGGGTAGFVSALILKTTFPTYQVDIIRSEKIGTIGVGEGTIFTSTIQNRAFFTFLIRNFYYFNIFNIHTK